MLSVTFSRLLPTSKREQASQELAATSPSGLEGIEPRGREICPERERRQHQSDQPAFGTRSAATAANHRMIKRKAPQHAIGPLRAPSARLAHGLIVTLLL